MYFLPWLSRTDRRIWSHFILSILRRMLSQLFSRQLRSVFMVLQWRSLQRNAASFTSHAVNRRLHVYMYKNVHATLYFLPQTFPDPPLALIYHINGYVYAFWSTTYMCGLVTSLHVYVITGCISYWTRKHSWHERMGNSAAAWSKCCALILPQFWLQYYHGNNVFWRYKYSGVTLIYVFCLSTNDELRTRQNFAEKISINLRSLSEDWTADLAFYM